MKYSFTKNLLLLSLFMVIYQQGNTQNRHRPSLSVGMPMGLQYMYSNSWKPYQANILFGLSVLYALPKKPWCVDGCFTSAFCFGKQLIIPGDETKISYHPFLTGAGNRHY